MRAWRIQLLALVGLAAIVRIAAYDVGPVSRADLRLFDAAWLAPWGSAHRLAEAAVVPFDPLPYALIFAAVVGAAVLTGRRALAISAAVVMLGATATTQVLKPLLSEPRPEGGRELPPDAWPSGHTTAAAALAIALVLLTPPDRRWAAALAAAAGTALVGAALVGLGSHYPSDILGGLCVAGAWGIAAWRLSRQARTAHP